MNRLTGKTALITGATSGKPSEVARAFFFASDESVFTVGSELVIDGANEQFVNAIQRFKRG